MDFMAIREGLAANLSGLPDCQVSPYLLDNPTPRMLSVAGFEEIDYAQSFGDDAQLMVIVEGCVDWGGAGDIAAQKKFDRWLAATGPESVREAVNSDLRLTSRLDVDGNLTNGHPPACDDLACMTFRGYRRARLTNGTTVLLGDWLVQVETSQ
jgi:hypothetical protein